MGDIGDYWNEHREYKRERKAQQRAAVPRAMKLLDEAGIAYRALDAYQEHYRVAERFDWWPSTGYWKALDGSKSGYKVRPLIRAIAAIEAALEEKE